MPPQNKMHINDWSAIQTLFDKLNKQLEKIMKTAPGLGVPRVYARILVSHYAVFLACLQWLKRLPNVHAAASFSNSLGPLQEGLADYTRTWACDVSQ